jgi:uncharacterized protein involved in exopolysaccharide biosynthesis
MDMRRYLETFSRHKIALTLPVVIALLVSMWYATSRPHKYESAMTVWFDTAAPSPSSLQSPNLYTTPAAQNQAVLQEFLATRQFLVQVGHRGPLASLLSGTQGANSGSPAASSAVDDEIAGILQRAFTVSVIGPNVAVVTMTGSSPGYLPGTLNAVAEEYVDAIGGTLKNRNTAAASYYQAQVKAARQTLDQANSAVSDYLHQHPGALPTTDLNYAQLVQAATNAQTNYTGLENLFQQTNLSAANAQSAAAFHVIDPPAGTFELSNRKHMIFTVVAGLAAGLVISALALSALTAVDKTARRQEDIDGVAGMEVVASIRELPRRGRLPGLRKAES